MECEGQGAFYIIEKRQEIVVRLLQLEENTGDRTQNVATPEGLKECVPWVHCRFRICFDSDFFVSVLAQKWKKVIRLRSWSDARGTM